MIEYIDRETNLFPIADEIIVDSNTVYDRSTKRHYLKLGAGFDIETSKIETPDATFGFCYHWQMAIGEHVIMGRNLDTMLLFFTELSNYLHHFWDNPKLLVWDANLGYEWQYCKKYWKKLGITELFAKNVNNPLKFLVGGNIEFRECLGLFGSSLSRIAKDYTKTQKLIGDLDYSLVRLESTIMQPKEIDYCINDVKILAELGEYVFENHFGKKPKLPLTRTGRLREKIKRNIGGRLKFVKEQIQSELPPEDDFYIMRQYGMKGGICGTNALYMDRVLTNVRCADLTSDYPAQMEHEKFPMGKCVECKPEEFCTDSNTPYMAIIGFVGLMSTTTHSLFSAHKCLNRKDLNGRTAVIDNGRIHSIRADYNGQELVAKFVLSDVEIKGFDRAYTYEKAYIYKCWKWEKYDYLPRYLLDCLTNDYLVKQKLKADGKQDTIEYKETKGDVNSYFGMCCTALFPYEKILLDDENCTIIESPNKKTYEEATKNLFLNPFWGFWVTSYARNILIEIITTFPKLIVQYDTDSIYYITDSPDTQVLEMFIGDYNENIGRLNDALFDKPEFHDLGAWSFDPPFKRFKALGSKRYMYETQKGKIKQVIAGLSGSLVCQCKANNFVNGTNIDPFDFFKDGMVVSSQYTRKMESVRIDDEFIVDYKDYTGNTETIESKSSLVLLPTDFTLGITDEHIDFFKTIQAMEENVKWQ